MPAQGESAETRSFINDVEKLKRMIHLVLGGVFFFLSENLKTEQ